MFYHILSEYYIKKKKQEWNFCDLSQATDGLEVCLRKLVT